MAPRTLKLGHRILDVQGQGSGSKVTWVKVKGQVGQTRFKGHGIYQVGSHQRQVACFCHQHWVPNSSVGTHSNLCDFCPRDSGPMVLHYAYR